MSRWRRRREGPHYSPFRFMIALIHCKEMRRTLTHAGVRSLMARALLVVVAALHLAHGSMQAQSWLKPAWVFERHTYYEPLAAEPRSAQMKVLFPGRASSVPFAVNPGQGVVWDISV